MSARARPTLAGSATDPWRGWLAFGLAVSTTSLHLLTAPDDWDLFRDELYYLANAEHLDLGYADHPPLIAWLTWLVRSGLGESKLALRSIPAVTSGLTVVFAGRIARDLGGKRGAELLAAVATAMAPVSLATFGYLSMNACDVLLWAVACWTLVRRFAHDEPRWWLAFGAVAGVGLENKLSILVLGAGVLLGLMLSPARRDLRTRWPWVGAAIAAILFAPHLVWQAQHGWPTLEFIANATATKNLPLSPASFLGAQVEQMGIFAAPIFVAGLASLVWSGHGGQFRALGWAVLATLALMIVVRAKAYYFAPAYTVCFAAGAVSLERWLGAKERSRRWTWVAGGWAAVVVAWGASALPLVKPVLSVDATVAYMDSIGQAPDTGERKVLGRLPQFLADRLGWRELAQTVAQAHASLPPDERAVACVFAQNYGQAGAIDLYGPALGLPPAISGHNSYWMWGPRGCTGEVVLVIDGRGERMAENFATAQKLATYACADCMPYEANKEVWVGRTLRAPMAQAWPRIKHFD